MFLSTETDSMFILTVHLRGFQKKNINIEINEDGSLIMISGEKEVQETVVIGWRLHRKEKEIRVFKKAFKIPDGVILDRVRAKFDEDESILTISMPKKEKGIRGFSVEEVTVEHELGRGGSSGRLQIDEDDHHHHDGEEQQQEEEGADGRQDVMLAEQRTEKDDHGEENKIKDDKEGKEEGDGHQECAHNEDAMEEKGKFKICTPIVAGSALLLSIVVFVIHFIRTKSQPGKRKD